MKFKKQKEGVETAAVCPFCNTPSDLYEKYFALLYAVGHKYPGESRHETALRYIKAAEMSSDEGKARSAAANERTNDESP